MTRPNEWVAQHIQTITGRAIGGRKARARRCKCGQLILVGLDGDYAAIEVRVDPHPLGMVGEAVAQLEGRKTYALRPVGRGVELHHRDRWQIAEANRPGRRARRHFDIVAAHVCGEPLLELVVPSVLPARRPPKETHDRPPF